MKEINTITVVPFCEHPIKDFRNTDPGPFDISAKGTKIPPDFITDGNFDLQAYCFCLLNKLHELPNSSFEDFLCYQCRKVSEPLFWINKFEKLIAENSDFSNTKKWNASVLKMNTLIALQRLQLRTKEKELHSKEDERPVFNFKKLKKEIAGLPIEEQIIRLHEEKADYLQNMPRYISTMETPFDEAIDIELEKIEKITPYRKQVLNGKSKPAAKPLEPTIRLNCNLNIFVDVFYQMLNEKSENGKPILASSSAEITDLICNNFLDKEGNEISPASVRTILSPGKNDKRPKGTKRIKIKASKDFEH